VASIPSAAATRVFYRRVPAAATSCEPHR
jgi:hypothetical protein